MNELLKDRALQTVSCAGQGDESGLNEITLVPWGNVESTQGSFVVDDESGELIVAEFKKQGVDLVIDYEHETLGGEFASSSGRAPAAGWIHKLWAVAGTGIKGLVKWTEAAREDIRSGRYRYLSPVLMIRKTDRKAVALHSGAVTNKPAIVAMERLAATAHDGASSEAIDPAMIIGEIATLLGVKTEETGSTTATMIAIRDALRKLKGVGDDETESAVASDRLATLDVLAMVDDGSDDLDESTPNASKPDTPMTLVRKIRDLLKLGDDAKVLDVLKSVLSKLTPSQDDAEKTDTDAVPSSQAVELATLRADVAALKSTDRALEVHKVLEPYVRKGVLQEDNRDDYEDFMALAASNPKLCRRMLDSRVHMLPLAGSTSEPSQRQQFIGNALTSYRADGAMQKACSATAAVDQALRDKNMEPLSEAEKTEYNVS